MENEEFLREILNELTKEQLINLLIKKQEKLNDNKIVELTAIKKDLSEQKGYGFPFNPPIINQPIKPLIQPYDLFSNNKIWC